jgi:hypothetical protein
MHAWKETAMDKDKDKDRDRDREGSHQMDKDGGHEMNKDGGHEMIHYESSQKGFTLTEQQNDEDIEFTIVIKDIERYLPAMKQLRDFYNADDVYTDVLFYVHKDNEYQIIVRHDMYVDFVLRLFKHKFISRIAWSD